MRRRRGGGEEERRRRERQREIEERQEERGKRGRGEENKAVSKREGREREQGGYLYDQIAGGSRGTWPFHIDRRSKQLSIVAHAHLCLLNTL